MKRFCKTTLVTAAVMVLVSVTACSKDDKKPATQVAAKVNSTEISVHQINYVLSRAGANSSTPEQAAALRKTALDRLIEQQLAVDEAIDKKLDRQPDVLMALDLARREVLGRAFLESIVASTPKPSEEEAKKYYADNPPLFAQRRMYSVQELVIPTAAGAGVQLKEMVAAKKSLEDIAAFLKSRNIQFNAGSAQRAAEQIPLEILPRIHALKDGDEIVIESPQVTTVVRLVASQPASVTEAQALPRIVQFLANQRSTAAAQKEIARLKEKAKITYEGEFVPGAAAPAPAAASPAPQAAPVQSAPAPAAPSPAAPAPSSGDSGMEKGLRGLK